jgi:outer membrane protein TolC
MINVLVSIACAAGIAFPSSAQQADEIVLTLDRAVELALRNNETLLSTQLDEDHARARVREAYSEVLPKLDFSSSLTRNWALPEFNFGGQTFKVGTDNVINFGLDLSQTLYRGGQVGAGLKIARYFQQISETNTDQMRENVVLEVYNGYYDVLLAEATLEVSTAAYDRAVAQYEGVQRFYEAGTVSDYDVLRASVEVTNAQPLVTQARNGLAIAKADLKRLIGLPRQARVRCTGSLDIDASSLPGDIETAVDQALAHRSDLKAAELQSAMNDASVRLARGENRPDISLSAGYLMQAQVNDPGFKSIGFNDFSRSWNTLINVSIPVFDGRQNSGRIMQAQADYELSRYVERQLGKQIEVDVTEAVLNVVEASERVRAGEEAIELASRGLSIAQVQYEGGVSTQLELIDAQFVLKQAETDHVTAKYDYATAAANLRNVLGMMDVRSDDR